MPVDSPRLRITEIFYSLQGESSLVGLPTVFVRLTGCPLRCGYCDTSYSFTGGEWQTLEAIVASVKQYKTPYVCVTGGEPLAQKACNDLLIMLCDQNFRVSLETSGAMDVSAVDPRVTKVMDLKTPASGEMEKNRLQNIEYLSSHDEVKFVICNREDYDWAKQILEEYKIDSRCQVLFSPVHGDIAAVQLAEWILQDHLNVRFQIQLHKYLWGETPGK
ncbi:MAG TPA: 7-carboxy-7-deazaguanine synthase QueE [Gammaproteobacteria bacterium]